MVAITMKAIMRKLLPILILGGFLFIGYVNYVASNHLDDIDLKLNLLEAAIEKEFK